MDPADTGKKDDVQPAAVPSAAVPSATAAAGVPAGDAAPGEAEPPRPPPEEPPFVKRVKERLGDAVVESRMFADEPTLFIKPDRLVEVCTFLRDDAELRFDYLASVAGVDYPERTPRFDGVYNLYSLKTGLRLNVVARVAEDECPSVTGVWRTADWHEREAFDLMGIRFQGHPNLKRILLPDWWEGHPLRKDYPLEGRGEQEKIVAECLKGAPEEASGGTARSGAVMEAAPSRDDFGNLAPHPRATGREPETQILEINMGPQHPSTHGVLRVILYLEGETVVDAECDIGYLHRGLEKICENRTYPQALTLTDRMDYIAAVSNNLGYVEAVEKLLQVEVPRRAQYIRVLWTELQRVASHLVWLATHAIDIGAMTVFLYCFREREKILDLIEKYCGARLTTSTFRIGGLRDDLPKDAAKEIREFALSFPGFVDEYETLLTRNRIWLDRTRDIGVISGEEAIAWGLSGPVLRGSGVRWDIRKAYPYECYKELDFKIPIGRKGDTYDRYLVRMEEMRQSNAILLQCLDGLPEGEIKGPVKKIIKPPPGMVYHSIEAPKGELGYLLVSDGSQNPYRLKVRPPSFINLQALPRLVRGHLVADVVAIIGTLDIVLGEIDR